MSPRASALLRRLEKDERGFTLVELLTAATLSIVLLSAVLLFMDTGLREQSSLTKANVALNQQRVGLERITREVRQATSFALVNSQVIEFTMYVPGSSPAQQRRVRYDCSQGDVCRRSSGPVGGAFTSTGVAIVSVVQNADVFDPQPDLYPTYVSIALKVRAEGARDDPDRVITLRDGVDLRNTVQ